MECDEELKANPPDMFKSILANEPSWCGRTPQGAWAADEFRAHWTCPIHELPREIQLIVASRKDDITWTPGKELVRWLKLVARHASAKPAYVSMYDDRWIYTSDDEVISSVIRVPPPLGALDYKFDAQFLADALVFLGDSNSALSLALTYNTLPGGFKAWVISNERLNARRYACVAPAKTTRWCNVEEE
jgi:hypothetical protein